MESHGSDLTLAMVQDGKGKCTSADLYAFREFMAERRSQDYLAWMLQDVQKFKLDLCTSGSPLARLLASWWRAGVHPLQPGGMDE